MMERMIEPDTLDRMKGVIETISNGLRHDLECEHVSPICTLCISIEVSRELIQ